MKTSAQNTHRRRTYTAGIWAEWAALFYLMLKGYWPVARRFKCPAGEIDLIVLRRKQVVFVEVKYRAHKEDAATSITSKQSQRIIRAAQFWAAINARKFSGDMRFDAVLLSPWAWPAHIEHAFVDNRIN